jgi:hypothetical protein
MPDNTLNIEAFNKLLVDRWAAQETKALTADPPRYAYGMIDNPFPLIVWPGGVTEESPELPYLQYDEIIETKYKAHQILKKTTATPESVSTQYKNPSSIDYQYALIGSAGDKYLRNAMNSIYNYLTTDAFMIAMQELHMAAIILSPVTELATNKSEIMERRYFFDIRINYADVFTEDETGVSVIETAEYSGGPVENVE